MIARKAFFIPVLVFFFAFSGLLKGQSPGPSLIIDDLQGNPPYTSGDNSTVFEIQAGAMFGMEVTGTPESPFGVYLSWYTTPFPTNITPPPLFIFPPFIPIVAGPNVMLDLSGSYSFYLLVPSEFSVLGYDIELFFQGFVQDPVNGFELTNGIKVVIVSSKYTADLALAKGNSLSDIETIGRLQDAYAGDNMVPEGGGPGLLNGESIVDDTDVAHYSFVGDSVPDPGDPDPCTSIYLNGILPLVPGDAGYDSRVLTYAKTGSSMDINMRNRICRNAENKNLQHIIVPVFDEQGVKEKDLNIYHFKDGDEFGFFVLDVLNNDFYELSGTRMTSDNPLKGTSPWDSFVAISPDGMLMAAVVKHRSGDIQSADDLYVIRLWKDDEWTSGTGTGKHARKVKLNSLLNTNYRQTRIYADSMTFAGDPDPHALFLVCNKCIKSPPDPVEPPLDVPSVLWYTHAGKGTSTGVYFPSEDLPLVGGDSYEVKYFGTDPFFVTEANSSASELKWHRSEDNKLICLRAAGRYLETGGSGWIYGEYCYDLFGLTDIQCTDAGILDYSKNNIKNLTNFPEANLADGRYTYPFGPAYNGASKSCLSDGPGTFLTFVTRENSDVDQLYLTTTDGSQAGTLEPITNDSFFKGDFQEERGIYDPYFLDEDKIVFFCGQKEETVPSYYTPMTDFFLYLDFAGELHNLTQTGKNPYYPFNSEPDPPFNYYGDVRPCGLFPSPDGRYIFFFRGETGSGNVGTKTTNLVGVDTLNNYSLFDLTGSEFNNGIIPATNTECHEIVRDFWGPETMNIFRFPFNGSEMLFFSMRYASPANNHSQQVFMVNMDFPIAAMPVTSFASNENGLIDNFIADKTCSYIAFSRSDRLNYTGEEGAYEKIFIVDLSGAYMRDLTEDTVYSDYTAASVDGSFRFLSSASSNIPGELIFGMGFGDDTAQADNPEEARLWLYPVQGVSEPTMPSTSYPLTEEGQVLLFNALEYDK